MTALLPEKNQEQFPPTLFVTELATQRDVKLGEHYVMRCRLDVLSEKQVGVVLSCVCCCLGENGGDMLLTNWTCGSLDMLCKKEEGFMWSSKCCRLLGSFADCKQQPGDSLLQLSFVSSCGRHTAGQQAADRSDVTTLAAKVGCRPLTRCMTLSVSTQQLFELKQAEGTFQ